jgi:hypothetical protein
MKKSMFAFAAALLGAPLLLLGLTACIGGPAADETATSKTTQPQGSSTEDELSQALDVWNVTMVQCLREEGLDVADPKAGEGFPELKGDDAIVKAATTTCSDKIGDPPTMAGNDRTTDAENIKQGTAIAQCLRDAGYEATDPTKDQALSIGSPENPDIPHDVMQKCHEEGLAAIGR